MNKDNAVLIGISQSINVAMDLEADAKVLDGLIYFMSGVLSMLESNGAVIEDQTFEELTKILIRRKGIS